MKFSFLLMLQRRTRRVESTKKPTLGVLCVFAVRTKYGRNSI